MSTAPLADEASHRRAPLQMLWLEGVSDQAVPLAPVVASCGFTGFPSPAQDYTERSISLDEYLGIRQNTTWYFVADGDSMSGMGIAHGDILVVDSSLDPQLGDLCICVAEGEYVAKVIDLIKGVPHLISAHKAYPPVPVSEVQVFGVVTGRVSQFRRGAGKASQHRP